MSGAHLLLEGAVVALRSPASGLFYAPCEAEQTGFAAEFNSPHYAFHFVKRGGLVGFAARADDGDVRYVQANRTRPFRVTLGASAFSPFAQFVVVEEKSETWDWKGERRPTVRLRLASRMLPQFEWSVELVPEPEATPDEAELAAAGAAAPSHVDALEPSHTSLKLLLVRDAALQHAAVRRAVRTKRASFEAWWLTARAAHRRRVLLQRAVLQLADRISASALLGWADVTVRRRRQRALVAAFVRRSQLRTLFLAFSEWHLVASAARARLSALLHALRRLEPARLLNVALHSWAETTAVRRRHRLMVANMLARRRVRLLAAIMSSWSLEVALARLSTDQDRVLAVAQSEAENLQLLAELQRAQTLSVAVRLLARSAQRRMASRVLLGWAQHAHAARLSACLLSRCTAALSRRRCRVVLECWADSTAQARQRRALVAGLRLRQQRRMLSAVLRCWVQLAAEEARERELSQAHDAVLQIRLADLDGVDALRSRCVAALLRFNERRRQSQLLGAAWFHWLQHVRDRQRRSAVLLHLTLRRHVRLLRAIFWCWRERARSVVLAEALLQRTSRRKLVASLRAWSLLAGALQVQRQHAERVALLRSRQALARAFELWHFQMHAGRALRASAETGDAALESISLAYESCVTHFRRRVALQLMSRAIRAWQLHTADCSRRRLLVAHVHGLLVKRRLRLVLIRWHDMAASMAHYRRLCDQMIRWRQRRALYACFGSWAETAKHDVEVRRAARSTADAHTQLVIAHAAAEAESAGLHENCVSLFVEQRSRRLMRAAFAELLSRARSVQHRRALVVRVELVRRRRCLVSCLQSWTMVARAAANERLLSARAAMLHQSRLMHAVFHAWLDCASTTAQRDALLSALDVVAERWCRRALLRRMRDSFCAWMELMAAASVRNALVRKLAGLQRRRTLSRCLALWADLVKKAKRAQVCVEHAVRSRCRAVLRRTISAWARLALVGRSQRAIAQARKGQHKDAARWHEAIVASTNLRRRTRCLLALFGAWSEHVQRKQASCALSEKLVALASARRVHAAFISWMQLAAGRRWRSSALARAVDAAGVKLARRALWAWFRVAVLVKTEGVLAVQERRATDAFVRSRFRSVMRAWYSRAARSRCLRRLSSRVVIRVQHRILTAMIRAWLADTEQQRRATVAADALLARSQRRSTMCCFLAWREAALAEASERLMISLQATSGQLQQESADRARAVDELRAQLDELQQIRLAEQAQAQRRLLTAVIRAWLANTEQQRTVATAADALLARSHRRRTRRCFLAWREVALAEASERLVLSLQATSGQLLQESADHARAVDELRAQLDELQQVRSAEHASAERALAAGEQRARELVEEATEKVRAAAALALLRNAQRRVATRVVHAWAQRTRSTRLLAFLLRRAAASSSRRHLQLSLDVWANVTVHKRRQRSLVAACAQQRRRRALLASLRWWAAVTAEQLQERREADAQQCAGEQRLDGVSAAVELYTRRSQRRALVAVFAAWVQCWQLARLSDASERHLAARVTRRRMCSAFATWAHLARQRSHWSAVVRNCRLRTSQLLARRSLQAWAQCAAAWTRNRHLQEQFVRRRLEKVRSGAFRAWRAAVIASVCRSVAFSRMVERLRRRHLAAAYIAWASHAAEARARRARKEEEAALLEEKPSRVSSHVYVMAIARTAAELWVRKAQRRIAARLLHAWARHARAASRRAALLRRAIIALSVRRLQNALTAWVGVAVHKRRQRELVAVCAQQRRRRALLASLRWWAAVTAEQLLERREADAQQFAGEQRLDGVSAAVELYTRRSQRRALEAVFAAWVQCWQLARLSDASERHLAARVTRRRMCSAFATWAHLARQRSHWSAVVRNCRLRISQLLARRSLQAWALCAAACTRNRRLQTQFTARRKQRAAHAVLASWAALASAESARDGVLDLLLRRALLHRLQSRLRLAFEAWLLLARTAAAHHAQLQRKRDVASTTAAFRAWHDQTQAGVAAVRRHYAQRMMLRALRAWSACIAASQLNTERHAVAEQAAARRALRLAVQLLRAWLQLAQAAQRRRAAASQLAFRRATLLCRDALQGWCRCTRGRRGRRDAVAAFLDRREAAMRRAVLLDWQRCYAELSRARAAVTRFAERRASTTRRSVLREWRRWHAAHARSRASLDALLQAARAAWCDKTLRAAWAAWAAAARGASLSRGRYWAGSVSLSSWQQLATVALQAWASYAKRSRAESRRLVAHAFVGWRFAAAVAGAAA